MNVSHRVVIHVLTLASVDEHFPAVKESAVAFALSWLLACRLQLGELQTRNLGVRWVVVGFGSRGVQFPKVIEEDIVWSIDSTEQVPYWRVGILIIPDKSMLMSRFWWFCYNSSLPLFPLVSDVENENVAQAPPAFALPCVHYKERI